MGDFAHFYIGANSTFRGGDKLRGADGFGLEVVVDGVTVAEFTGVRQHQIISCSLVVEGGRKINHHVRRDK